MWLLISTRKYNYINGVWRDTGSERPFDQLNVVSGQFVNLIYLA